MSEVAPLDNEWATRLAGAPLASFVPLAFTGTRVSTVGLLSFEDGEPVGWDANPALTLRPDKLPAFNLTQTMLRLTPLYFGETPVGWLAQLPALNITLGRNFVKVVRGRGAPPDEAPTISVQLKSLIVLEIPDRVALLLSTAVRDMRI